MENNDFVPKLHDYIKYAFDNEANFILEFLREYAGCELNNFYMASKQCYVGLIDTDTGSHYGVTIDTGRFIDWFDENNTRA